ncbi:MAG: 4'-phosphopantetheinyl transferase superfamily protein [Thermoguttaceae bacterium]|nr:4'-phosphopantetheinyl transferase superfamily protein [Thermoguttaceae bacterium]
MISIPGSVGEVDSPTLYFLDFSRGAASISDEELAKLAARTSLTRRAKIERYRRRDDKARSLAAGLLLRALFDSRVDEIRVDASGKPYLENGPEFNLSHSGSFVALAVASKPIGCDVQVREKISPELIAKRFFAPSETALIFDAEPLERERIFYRIWTLKESFVKALGARFAESAKKFSIALDENGNARVESDELPSENARFWFRDDSSSSLAVCSMGASGELRIVEVDAEKLFS